MCHMTLNEILLFTQFCIIEIYTVQSTERAFVYLGHVPTIKFDTQDFV